MATTVRTGAANAGRDQKTGTSPSSSSPFGKKSARPSLSSSSSSSTTGKNSPAMDRKQPPSYLRPTKSSKSLDPSPVPKRSNTDSSAQKTTTTRRRSFDRPPPASQVQKAIQGSPGAREAKTLRSSSFSIKSTSSSPLSARASLERQSSLGKAPVRDRKVEPQLSKLRSVNRGAMASKTVPKGSSKLALNKKSPKSVTSESSNECDNQSVEHLVSDDEIGYVHDKSQALPEISEMPDSNEELKDPTNLQLEAKHVEEEHNQPEVHHESVDEKPTAEHQAQVQSEEQTVQSEEQSNQTGEEGAGNQDETDEEPPKVEPTDTPLKEKEEETEKMEELPAKEAEKSEEEAEVKDQKQSVRSPSPLARSQSAGKKGNQAYNDVIEQTASKLMGKKNKVLALAGAFETVISLQDRKH
ncbi:hypothetical protein Cgig2_011397 [Carnegiea gigantea]|uniref:Calmodulin-binding domain-containing protein n=1 Tax=Carnegiea gigantea TaxID=171969 RepID=A0A9Q1KTY1_9CARY|nr:hypothetical protein Cgig2_011397 [Carnegiea gigantea]